MDEPFKTIAEHWAHFLERDIDPRSPDEQVSEMKRAFAAGAISGLQLAVLACRQSNAGNTKSDIAAHVEGIKTLVRSSTTHS